MEQKIKQGKLKYQAKPKKNDAKTLIQQQNAQVVQQKISEKPNTVSQEQDVKPEKGKRIQKVLGKKKTLVDNKGDEWEVVDKRETVLIQKNINTDSEEGSELSYD